jgi:hypothetical protein
VSCSFRHFRLFPWLPLVLSCFCLHSFFLLPFSFFLSPLFLFLVAAPSVFPRWAGNGDRRRHWSSIVLAVMGSSRVCDRMNAGTRLARRSALVCVFCCSTGPSAIRTFSSSFFIHFADPSLFRSHANLHPSVLILSAVGYTRHASRSLLNPETQLDLVKKAYHSHPREGAMANPQVVTRCPGQHGDHHGTKFYNDVTINLRVGEKIEQNSCRHDVVVSGKETTNHVSSSSCLSYTQCPPSTRRNRTSNLLTSDGIPTLVLWLDYAHQSRDHVRTFFKAYYVDIGFILLSHEDA